MKSPWFPDSDKSCCWVLHVCWSHAETELRETFFNNNEFHALLLTRIIHTLKHRKISKNFRENSLMQIKSNTFKSGQLSMTQRQEEGRGHQAVSPICLHSAFFYCISYHCVAIKSYTIPVPMWGFEKIMQLQVHNFSFLQNKNTVIYIFTFQYCFFFYCR